MLENTQLKKKVVKLEEEKLELKQAMINLERGGGGPATTVMNGGIPDMNEMY